MRKVVLVTVGLRHLSSVESQKEEGSWLFFYIHIFDLLSAFGKKGRLHKYYRAADSEDMDVNERCRVIGALVGDD